MSSLEKRYPLIPQMQIYDHLPSVVAPYMLFVSQPNYTSSVVAVDRNGFRVSRGKTAPAVVDSISWWQDGKRGIVLGGSCAFGWGATEDRYTIASVLNAQGKYSFLNLGIRGGNSTQELIAAIPFLPHADCIIVCSGINNLTVNIQSIGRNELYGPFFFEESYRAAAELPIWELNDQLSKPLSKTSFRRLAGELSARILRRIRLPRRPVSADDWLATYDEATLAKIARRVIEIQLRDLRMLARSAPSTTRLIFAAQPFAPSCTKTWTEEERYLFTLSDESKDWRVLKNYLCQLWPGYVAELAKVCGELNITFVDLNKVQFDGWCFVDSVHMTDNGYRLVAEEIKRRMN